MSLDVTLYAPSTCPHCSGEIGTEHCVFDANITHNLGRMADVAGIYKPLWRPEEIGATLARHLIEPLRAGLADMKARPEHYERYNAENGWGLYKHFVPWVERYLEACEQNPNARVEVSR